MAQTLDNVVKGMARDAELTLFLGVDKKLVLRTSITALEAGQAWRTKTKGKGEQTQRNEHIESRLITKLLFEWRWDMEQRGRDWGAIEKEYVAGLIKKRDDCESTDEFDFYQRKIRQILKVHEDKRWISYRESRPHHPIETAWAWASVNTR